VYRGVKKNLIVEHPKNRELVWWGFSSCTRDIKVLETEQFCGKDGTRTIFHIQSTSAVDLQLFSTFPSEEEVVLRPGTCFKVSSSADMGHDLAIINLVEQPTPFLLVD